MRRLMIASVAGAAVLASLPVVAQQVREGVKLPPASFVRLFYSAKKVEGVAAVQYRQLREQATRSKAILPVDDPQTQRVQRLINEMLPHTHKWHKRAKDWNWEVVLIKSPAINALCMPGGKIAVFTGILETLKLTDDEAAMVIGHEMAHALREHARERAAKNMLHNASAMAMSVLIGGGAGDLTRMGGGLLSLSYNRGNEKEADLVGMELAARAGYDPRAALTLWEKMGKVMKLNKSRWLSTHPTGDQRAALIKANLSDVLPLYERARAGMPPRPPTK